MSDDVVVVKEMGITHEEFFRNIPRVFGTADVALKNHGVTLIQPGKVLEIGISEQSERRIALIVLPITVVTLTFKGYSEVEVSTFVETFDRAFQRGGG